MPDLDLINRANRVSARCVCYIIRKQGPVVTVAPAENLMRDPFALGCSPAPAHDADSLTPRCTCIAASNSVLGGTPARYSYRPEQDHETASLGPCLCLDREPSRHEAVGPPCRRGREEVLVSGICTCPPSASALNRRSAASLGDSRDSDITEPGLQCSASGRHHSQYRRCAGWQHGFCSPNGRTIPGGGRLGAFLETNKHRGSARVPRGRTRLLFAAAVKPTDTVGPACQSLEKGLVVHGRPGEAHRRDRGASPQDRPGIRRFGEPQTAAGRAKAKELAGLVDREPCRNQIIGMALRKSLTEHSKLRPPSRVRDTTLCQSTGTRRSSLIAGTKPGGIRVTREGAATEKAEFDGR